MAFSVLNNIAGLSAQKEMTLNQVNMQQTLFRLASGKRINSGADDAAGLAIADGLKGQMMALDQAVRNANDGIGFLQTADGALNRVTTLLHRAVTLTSEAATSTNSASRSTLNSEYTLIKSEIDRIAGNTYFNGTDVFGAALSIFVGDTKSTSFIGIDMTGVKYSSSGLGAISGTETEVASELTKLQSALTTVATYRGNIGGQVNRLQSAIGVIMTQNQNVTAAESQIRDANMAEEIANMTKLQILSQSGMSAMVQANSQAQSVLSLFR